ncbi:ribonuclease HI [Neobacillus sp. YIM B02564]|uniref:ribonuclease H n=1 Tax=Neobacillus paridis TaxID=2803862 RepID=A0ABS1TIP5_9BACI|nr:ribonuclease HI [Neobacillus paridis]
MEKVIIYCDGGCRGNQNTENIGGWGVVFKYKDKVKEMYGGEKNTTNNIMELTAAIKALEAIKTTNIPIQMYIDSAYVINGMNEWIHGWIKNNWKKSNKKPVENKELWIKLNDLRNKQSSVEFIKVKGHDGVELNELADTLANKGMDELE